MFLKKIKTKKSGFTLIEMLVFIFIVTLVSITFYKLFVTSTQAMSTVRSRLDALALANEKMEIIRNLNYEDVGTTHGIPIGQIEEGETVLRDAKTFYVHTSVINVDDPFDGTMALGTDAAHDDYKQVKVQASWQQNNPSKEVSLVSTIVPPGLESIYTGGILSLHVVDNSGQGIPNAHVGIINNTLNPVVNTSLTTDNQGNLFISQAVPANQSYNLQISKSGYFPVQTFAPYPTSTVSPVDVDATVVGGAINQKTLVTDRESTINMKTQTPLGVAVSNINFALAGGKKTGDTVVVAPAVSQPVWAYNSNSLTSAVDGTIALSNMSSGPYFFKYGNSAGNSGYTFLHMDPVNNAPNSFDVSPGVALDENIVVADNNLDSLWVSVKDIADSTNIADAVVELKNADSSYDVTLATDKFGQVFFPDSSMALTGGSYELNISAPGYADIKNQAVTINKFTAKDIQMTAN